MRILNPSLAVVSLLGFLTAASCTLITDVDRTKIPTDAGAHAGEPGSGGSAGEPGTGGTGNKAGSSNGATGGTEAGTGGGGGAEGGTAGMNAGAAGVSEAGTGGTTTPTMVCDKAKGAITIKIANNTFIGDGETFTVGDGVHSKVTFTFDWTDGGTPITGPNVIKFSGTPTPAEIAVMITDAINGASSLDVTATTTAAGGNNNGNGGAGGESGAGSTGTSGQGGEAGAAPAKTNEVVDIVNQRAGARGNVTITEKFANPNFSVSGMSGGNAVACTGDTACSSDAECDSARTCGTDHLCQ